MYFIVGNDTSLMFVRKREEYSAVSFKILCTICLADRGKKRILLSDNNKIKLGYCIFRESGVW